MDQFIEEFNAQSFPVGTVLAITATGYLVKVKGMPAVQGTDPLRLVRKAKERYDRGRTI